MFKILTCLLALALVVSACKPSDKSGSAEEPVSEKLEGIEKAPLRSGRSLPVDTTNQKPGEDKTGKPGHPDPDHPHHDRIQ